MAIRRDISVLTQGISADIDIVYGTDLVPIEFYITDYMLPSNAIATLYCTTNDKKLHKKVGEIKNNVISFNPPEGYFSIGKNNLQIRITADGKNLYSFETNVNCKTNMVSDDAAEVESQPTLVTQLLTNIGETKELAQRIRGENENISEEIEEICEEMNKEKSNNAQLSNPNLFINGNFQIWQRGTSFDVVGYANQDAPVYTADMWLIHHNDADNIFAINKTDDGLHITGPSTQECAIYQIMEETTYNAIKGKTLTLSYGYTKTSGDANNVEYEYVEESKQIVASDTTAYGFAYNNAIRLTIGTAGCTLHWVKLEVGTIATPCIPRLYPEELMLCQRYYYIVGCCDTTAYIGSSGIAYITVPQLMNMREVVNVIYNFTTFKLIGASLNKTCTLTEVKKAYNNEIAFVSDNTTYSTVAGIGFKANDVLAIDASIYPEIGVG